MLKMYVVVRADMSPGQQAVQAMHALATMAVEHNAEFNAWAKGNNTLVVLEVPNERRLEALKETVTDGKLIHSYFKEPDALPTDGIHHFDTLTAIAFAPDWTVQYLLLDRLPLAKFLAPKPPATPPTTDDPRSGLPAKRRWFW